MAQNLHICEKVYFDQLLDFEYCFYYSFTLFIVPYFTLWMLDFFNTIRVSNSLDPDQARHFMGPDLGQNCLQGLSGDIGGKELLQNNLLILSG